MSNWYNLYLFPRRPRKGPLSCFDPEFDDKLIRTRVYGDLDPYLNNIHGQCGTFWISSMSGGYGKSTMLHYIARRLYSNINSWGALPFHMSVGKKTPTIETTFFRSFLSNFFRLPENLSKAEATVLKSPVSTEIRQRTDRLVSLIEQRWKEVLGIEDRLAGLDAPRLENRFNYVLEQILKHWTNKGVFSKYVLLIDEMDHLATQDVLPFLGAYQETFQSLYEDFEFVSFISGHKSWVETILDGTEYSYHKGPSLELRKFDDISDVRRLVESRLTHEIHMAASNNPWAENGYTELCALSDGIPRNIIDYSFSVTNEAAKRHMPSIGPGIVREVLIMGEFKTKIETYLKSHYPVFLKLNGAVSKNVDDLLVTFYDSPGHMITKEYDKDLDRRTSLLGKEIDDKEWKGKVDTLYHLECLSSTDAAWILAKDLIDLYNRFSEHTPLMQQIIRNIIVEMRIEPKPGKLQPPDFHGIIERLFNVHSKEWLTKKTLFESFLDSTSVQHYVKLEKTENLDKFIKDIFEREFKKYVTKAEPNLMIFEEDDKQRYRLLPRAMQKDDFLTLKVFGSREILDEYIELMSLPRYDSDVIKRTDQYIERVLGCLTEKTNMQFEEVCLRKKSISKICKELELNPALRKYLNFYLDVTKSEEREVKTMIREVFRNIILGLAKDYERITSRRLIEAAKLKELLRNPESETLEKKASLCWDYREAKESEFMEFEVAKTVAAFMNTEGGFLIIGVDDQGSILGLEKDFTATKKQNRDARDAFAQHFTNIINSYLGKLARQYAKITFGTADNKDVAIVKVQRVQKKRDAAFLTKKGSDGRVTKTIYIRQQNVSQPLDAEETVKYMDSHWKD